MSVEVHLKFERGHFLQGTISKVLRQVTINFIGGLVLRGLILRGLVPTALPHRKVTILDETTERRLRIWPFARLLWPEFLRDQRLEPLLSLPFSEIANATQRNGSLPSLSLRSRRRRSPDSSASLAFPLWIISG
jgi:hypothetical protein